LATLTVVTITAVVSAVWAQRNNSRAANDQNFRASLENAHEEPRIAMVEASHAITG